MTEARRVYHVWFSTKERRPTLDGEVGHDLRVSFAEIAKRTSIGLLEFEFAIDHVHVLLEISSDKSLSSVMHQLKGASAHTIFLKYPDMRLETRALWQKGYGFRSIAPSEVTGLRYYIRTQSKRPVRREQAEGFQPSACFHVPMEAV
jgi:putative transposase